MFKNIYDSTEEIEVSFSVSDTGIYRIPFGRLFTTHEIWTGTGKTGTQLVENTDYLAGGTSARAGEIKGESVYSGFQITNAGYHATTLYATILWIGNIVTTEVIKYTGEYKYFPTYKERGGLLPWAFDNEVSQTEYADLYAEVGDIFEAQHVAAGDSAATAGYFYPTPIPGDFNRVGIPDIELQTADAVDDGTSLLMLFTTPSLRKGTKFILRSISGDIPDTLVDNTEYYLEESTAPGYYYFHSTEATAVAGTSRIAKVSGAGSGTFRLTQEGVRVADAFQGHWHKVYGNQGSSGGYGTPIGTGYGATPLDLTSAGWSARAATTDSVNGTPRTSNETRPSATYLFGYIQY